MLSPVHTEGVPQAVQSLRLLAVSAVNDPPVGLHQHGGAKVPGTDKGQRVDNDIRRFHLIIIDGLSPVSIPPVAGAGGGAAGAQDTLVQPIQLGSGLLQGYV